MNLAQTSVQSTETSPLTSVDFEPNHITLPKKPEPNLNITKQNNQSKEWLVFLAPESTKWLQFYAHTST